MRVLGTRSWGAVALCALVTTCSLAPARAQAPPAVRPKLPRQFSASIKITTKHLPKDNVYPPAWRTVDVHYDWVNKRAWAYTQTSYERLQNTTGTTTVRRYDLGQEFELSQFGKSMVCKWSRILNAKMPRPSFLPPSVKFVERLKMPVNGKDVLVNHWRLAEPDQADGDVPNDGTEPADRETNFFETSRERTPVLLETPDMTYEFVKFVDGYGRGADHCDALNESTYSLGMGVYGGAKTRSGISVQRKPPRKKPKKGKSKAKAKEEEEAAAAAQKEPTCERVPQDVGFPYIHLIHTYLRF